MLQRSAARLQCWWSFVGAHMCLSTPLAPKLSDESDAVVRVRWGEVHMWISCLSAKQPLLPSIESDSSNDKQLNLKKQYWCMCQSHCRSTDNNTHMWRRSQRINTRPKQVDSAGYFGVWRSILRLCSLSAIAETTCLKINRATKGGKREYLSHQGFRLFKWSSCLIDKKVQFCMTKYLDMAR